MATGLLLHIGGRGDNLFCRRLTPIGADFQGESDATAGVPPATGAMEETALSGLIDKILSALEMSIAKV